MLFKCQDVGLLTFHGLGEISSSCCDGDQEDNRQSVEEGHLSLNLNLIHLLLQKKDLKAI